MKIFVNDQHQIKAIRCTTNPELTEYEINENDFFAGKCDAFILGYCYHVEHDEDGNTTSISIYPYVDYNVLESFQNQYNQDQEQIIMQAEINLDTDYRLSNIELGLNSTGYRN